MRVILVYIAGYIISFQSIVLLLNVTLGIQANNFIVIALFRARM